jgi:hypothetical protein
MTLKDKISEDMKKALGARESERLGALRLIRAEILKAEKEKGESADDEKVKGLLQGMLKQRRDSIAQFEAGGRADLAAKERAEMGVILSYLPAPLSEAEMAAAVEEVVGALGAAEPKPMGKAMEQAMGKAMGQVMGMLKSTGRPFDGQQASAMVRARLGQGPRR